MALKASRIFSLTAHTGKKCGEKQAHYGNAGKKSWWCGTCAKAHGGVLGKQKMFDD